MHYSRIPSVRLHSVAEICILRFQPAASRFQSTFADVFATIQKNLSTVSKFLPSWNFLICFNTLMKLKQSPEDFQVQELTTVRPARQGRFAFYLLEKSGWTTPDALTVIRRRWKIDPRRLSYGGLKDRHAKTWQHLTIERGPPRNLEHPRIRLTYLGQVEEPFTAQQIHANRFTLILRAMNRSELRSAEGRAETLTQIGVPNYFDDQRFGSVTPGGEFVARWLVLGDFEQALKLALTGPYEHDRAAQKRQKIQIAQLWGQWAQLKEQLPRGHARSLVDYLVSHPTNFKGAIARLRPELNGMYLAAFQSYLWNLMLARWLQMHFPQEALAQVRLQLGPVPVPVVVPAHLQETWRSLELPLPAARNHGPAMSRHESLVTTVLADQGLTLPQLRIPGMDRPFFSRGERTGCVVPTGFSWQSADDEKHPRRYKLRLEFDLPRGSYATMVVKRLTAVEPLNNA